MGTGDITVLGPQHGPGRGRAAYTPLTRLASEHSAGALPLKLSARQKELLAEFRETETGDECPASQGFFGRIKDMWDDLTD